MRRAVERRQNVKIFDPVSVLCGPDNCAPIIGNAIVYRDGAHVAAKGLSVLKPAMEAEVSWLLELQSTAAATPSTPTQGATTPSR
jgi:hypothetical protein